MVVGELEAWDKRN